MLGAFNFIYLRKMFATGPNKGRFISFLRFSSAEFSFAELFLVGSVHFFFHFRFFFFGAWVILRRAIWVMVVEQGTLHPFVNRTFEWGVVIATFLCPFVLLPSPKI